ncbi:uncharacterized protein LOC128337705 [Hemicordylus capensis]|uniref:uncharacterized protein LOC128337705 n=1 Tax=Hemicordylus capensis TaxID=884348 RepID=UPI002303D1EB|nr:uncharacterized protein LOC128337705 [Hemicordylus capensis]
MWLLAKYLLLSSPVLHAQLLLYQTERLLFVDTGGTAEISCTSTDVIDDKGISFSWYRRRDGEITRLTENGCDKTSGKFVCKAKGQKVMLEISHPQKTDSGLYFCSRQLDFSTMSFSNGTSLIVGDSYTPSTWVMLLLPSASKSLHSSHLACVVHGASNLVQVSWNISGDLQQEGRVLLVKNSSGSLTFISLLSVPMVDSQNSRKLYTCEVRFNSSSKSVKKSAPFPAASSVGTASSDHNCTSYKIPLAVMVLLALLLLLLSFLWIRLGPSRLGNGDQTIMETQPYSCPCGGLPPGD